MPARAAATAAGAGSAGMKKTGRLHAPLYLPVSAGDQGTAQGRRGTAAPHGAYQAPKPLGLQDRYLYDYTFASNSGQNSLMNKAHAYVENCCRIPLAAMGSANANNFFVRGRKTYPHLRLPHSVFLLSPSYQFPLET